MGQEERCDILNAGFWYFLDAVMQNAACKANSIINVAKGDQRWALGGVTDKDFHGETCIFCTAQEIE